MSFRSVVISVASVVGFASFYGNFMAKREQKHFPNATKPGKKKNEIMVYDICPSYAC
jgi:hypothetical protein